MLATIRAASSNSSSYYYNNNNPLPSLHASEAALRLAIVSTDTVSTAPTTALRMVSTQLVHRAREVRNPPPLAGVRMWPAIGRVEVAVAGWREEEWEWVGEGEGEDVWTPHLDRNVSCTRMTALLA